MASFFVSYADGEEYQQRQQLQADAVRELDCFDEVLTFGPEDLSPSFKNKNRKLLRYEKGAGLWIWKPQILLQVFRDYAQPGDVVFYCDVDHMFVRAPAEFLELGLSQDILLFHEHGDTADKCTYPATFSYMNLSPDDYRDTSMILGGYHVWRVGVAAVSFVREWLQWCCDERVILPGSLDVRCVGSLKLVDESPDTNLKCHCFDQSVLTLLAQKRNVVPEESPKYRKYLVETTAFNS
jgi:hypothetical protein